MFVLDPAEVRVLGVLIEKEATTPEYYPLSLNALVNGCNQKSNRNPVVGFDEDIVNAAADHLRAKGFATRIIGNGRVTKFAQRISEALNLGRREMAILCTLLLRGPQTSGRSRIAANACTNSRTSRKQRVFWRKSVNGLAEQSRRNCPSSPGKKKPAMHTSSRANRKSNLSPKPWFQLGQAALLSCSAKFRI